MSNIDEEIIAMVTAIKSSTLFDSACDEKGCDDFNGYHNATSC